MLIRIYTDKAAMHGDENIAETVISRARAAGIAGATVLQGTLGFAATSIVHSHHMLGIGDNPPQVIEIIDSEKEIETFLPQLADLRGIGLVTTEQVNVLKMESKT
jgi:PII-like signaling protein